jgi:hypothetical protein
MNIIENDVDPVVTVPNKGTGAGGSNTTKYGNSFETKTNFSNICIDYGFIKTVSGLKKAKHSYFVKKCDGYTIYHTSQRGFRWLMTNKFGVDAQNIVRNPDEAYIIKYDDQTTPVIVKILEKKSQQCNGSVEDKLWCGYMIQREYAALLGPKFSVSYGYTVNSFLQKKIKSTDQKWRVLREHYRELDIPILFGDDADYTVRLIDWIYTAL